MRTSKILVMSAALLGVAAFSSCNVNDNIQDETNPPQAVCFSAGIAGQAVQNGAPGTRAAGDAWAANDAIGIFMVGNGTTTIAEQAENKQYTTTGGSTFSAVAGDEIYYPMDGSKVDFIAYYPYASGKTLGSSISVDVSGAQTASSQADIDLLWAKANNNGSGYTKATPNVALSFDHKLAKFVMNCTVESNTGIVAGDFSTAAVVINGMKTQTTLKLSDGAVGTASDPEAIIPNKLSTESGFLASYDAIIVPAVYSAGDIKVVFTLNGEAYTWTLGAESFAGAAEYIYTVTLTRTGVKATGTINPWTTVTRDPGTAE